MNVPNNRNAWQDFAPSDGEYSDTHYCEEREDLERYARDLESDEE